MRIPVATYRLQFHKGFTFRQALELLPYLRELGISDVYASPIFQAGPESTHGYDICGFDQLDPKLGSREDFDSLHTELRRLGMGLLVDMVPNHMGNHTSNCWWMDVLKHGPKSEFARYFDINWTPSNPLLHGKVLLPVLGDHYSAVLERGELKVIHDNGEFRLAYFDKHFPLSPESIAAFRLEQLTEQGRQSFLANLNGKPSDSASFDELHRVIDLQHYRLAYWRVGPHEINYRRFFDVTELVSVRVEDESVFQATHKLLLDLLHSGKINGLRIDHPDGLRDPKTYFERLQSAGSGTKSPSSPGSDGQRTYILAEKILSDEETLPDDWPIHGTTGYDYVNYANGLFVRRENEGAFTQIYERFTKSTEDFASLAFRSKQEVLNRMFIVEVNSLSARLKSIAFSTRYGRDFTEAGLRSAIVDFIAGFPVYRTYANESTKGLSSPERASIQHGLAEAKKRATGETAALDFLARILLLDLPADLPEDKQREAREFVIRFQQLSGPATAKGLEDTAFYRYTRFISLNEVGGNPGRFGTALEDFHKYNRYKQQTWPHSMLASSTHDTKRGEDTRARLNVLSEMPVEWEEKVRAWSNLNASVGSRLSPADEYLLYQTLVGTWDSGSDLSAYIERIQKYMLKAAREAKTRTAWTEPNESYESAIKEFVAAILRSAKFRDSLSKFAEEVAFFGMFNSIGQVVLKTCSPGVPDFYQGTEHWNLTLVDPDNRRPIDYELRKRLLANVRHQSAAELLREWQSGAIKLYTVAGALRARQENAALATGDYREVSVAGNRSNHVITFARSTGNSTVIVAVPRFIRTLTGSLATLPSAQHWGDTRLEFAGEDFKNLLTGERLRDLSAAEMFKTFPAAIIAVGS